MILDFTNKSYKKILEKLSKNGYRFLTFEDYFSNQAPGKLAILRHDVDRAPKNGVKMAEIENKMGIRASYYFRTVNESFDEPSINAIVKLGHELGYHYEDLSLANGNKETAYKTFEKNLEMFRKYYPIKTMCMHGSPMSKYDNRLIWEKYNYKDSGIIAEPYFDLDFNIVFYITDASRSWNNEAVTVRDKVKSNYNILIRNSNDIITLIENNKLPDKIMLSTHPHNWAESFPEWIKIKVWQGFKNQFKRILVYKT